jgi:pyridoxal/pyridoxine/pyridoxamine kinase
MSNVSKLTSINIVNERDALRALDVLHSNGIRRIVITSSDLAPSDNEMYVYCSCIDDDKHKGVFISDTMCTNDEPHSLCNNCIRII